MRSTSKQASLDDPLLRECYARSIRLLMDNSHESGVIAAAPEPKAVDRNYASIFGRDAAICSLGMVVSGDRELLRHAKKSLTTLARHQAKNGQIPKYVKPEKGEVDFWYSGCIDATLWWLIAVHFYNRQRPADGLAKQLRDNVKRAFTWLLCQEHQGLFLLQQNEASDWADIMPRSGFVLYTNALWYLVKELYRVPTLSKTRQCFKHLFFPFDKPMAEQRRARIMADYVKTKVPWSDVYLSFVNFSFWGRDVDVFGNILACLVGIPDKAKAGRIVDALIKRRANRPRPVRVMLDPIRKSSRLWRPYMERHDLNLPDQYHNGGGM